MKKAISYVLGWLISGTIVFPFLFAACNGLYVGLSHNKSSELQLDPLVIQIIGPYDSLLWPAPLYFLLCVFGGITGGMIGLVLKASKRH